MQDLGLTKQQADALLDKHVTDPATKLHMIETEAIMKALARRFYKENGDIVADAIAEKWGIIGLLHDIDWDLTKENSAEHCTRAAKILRAEGATDFLIETIQSHCYGMEAIPAFKHKERTTQLEHSLVAAETLTGLIVATALMRPDKKLGSVELSSLKKKFKTKGFAARCNREMIAECEKAGVPLDEFLELGLKALQWASNKLGM